MAEVVNFISDGLRLSPSEFAQVLSDCAQSGEIQQDSYALGGVVEEAEAKFAQLLGKDASERYRMIMDEAGEVDDIDV